MWLARTQEVEFNITSICIISLTGLISRSITYTSLATCVCRYRYEVNNGVLTATMFWNPVSTRFFRSSHPMPPVPTTRTRELATASARGPPSERPRDMFTVVLNDTHSPRGGCDGEFPERSPESPLHNFAC